MLRGKETRSDTSPLLVVTQDFPPEIGGIQRYAAAISRELARDRSVFVVAPGRAGVSRNNEAAYTLIRYPWPHTSLFGFSTIVSEPLVCLASRGRVAFHAQYATAIGSFIAKRLGLIRRYYIAAHAMEIRRERFGPAHLLWRDRVLRDADAIFPVSRYTAALLEQRGVATDRIDIVPNGVDLHRFTPRDGSALRRSLGLGRRRVILTVARLVRRKGVDTLITAYRNTLARHPETTLLIVGDGPDRQRLMADASDLVASGRARFVGRVADDELPIYYSLADVVTMPSRTEGDGNVEGFGLVFLEANACGAAVIGSRSGGIPDAVEDGVSGLLVAPGDPEGLTRALHRILSDDVLRSRLADQGRERAGRFTWRRAAERILARIDADATDRAAR